MSASESPKIPGWLRAAFRLLVALPLAANGVAGLVSGELSVARRIGAGWYDE